MIYTSHIMCRSWNKSWTKNNCRVCGFTWASEQLCCYSNYYLFSCCPWFLSYRVFRVWVWVGIHQFHFIDFIGIGIGCEGVGYLDVAEKEYPHPHPIVHSLLTPTHVRPSIHLRRDTCAHTLTSTSWSKGFGVKKSESADGWFKFLGCNYSMWTLNYTSRYWKSTVILRYAFPLVDDCQ